MSYANAWW
jgi:hypothetical protein